MRKKRPTSSRFSLRGEPLVDGGVLAGEPDAAAHPLRLLGHVDPVDERPPGVGRQERGEDADGGGLAGTVRPEHAEHRARLDLEVDAAQGLRVSELLAETVASTMGTRTFLRGMGSDGGGPESPTLLLARRTPPGVFSGSTM